jgi:hypothetical protein
MLTIAKHNPGASLDRFETPKAFMRTVACAIDGKYGDSGTCLTTVIQHWKNPTASRNRADTQ